MADRFAVVTGASSGIGRATALALARAGYGLILSGRSSERLRQTQKACLGAADLAGHPLIPTTLVEGDLRDAMALDVLRGYIDNLAGSLNAVVHAAAAVVQGPLSSTNHHEFASVFDHNVTATYNVIRVTDRHLGEGSTVVFVNSSVAINAANHVAAYSASKHAVKAMADAYRQEVNVRGIRVTSLYLGKTATPMLLKQFAERGEEDRYEEIAKVILQPEHVADTIAMVLALPPAAEITDLHLRHTARA